VRPIVRVRQLGNHPFLWTWEAEDPAGRRVEGSWEDHWEAFDSPAEALRAGLVRLGARVRAAGVTARARSAAHPGPVALVIVNRHEVALYESLRKLFQAVERIRVIRDRRLADRRRRSGWQGPERRRGERRSRPDVDAQVGTHGWSAVFVVGVNTLGATSEAHRPMSESTPARASNE
jgi:hypothetical protein